MGKSEIKIPDYTAEDFTNSSLPYEFLYKFKDNKFMLSQMREQMKQKAAAVGIRGFMGLWNSYLETIQAAKGVHLENATNFDGQELELMSGKYIADDYGIIYEDKFGCEVDVCRHPIMPIQRLVNIDSGEERLRIAYKKGRFWRSLIAEKTMLASSSGILQLAANGVFVNSENAKTLSTYLLEIEQLNYEHIPEQKSVGRLGWVGEHGFSPYVENLEFDGEQSFRHIFNAVRQEGSYDEWKEIMLKMRASSLTGRIFLAASFASVLVGPCGLLPFFVHAWGGTEVGKTVGLMIAASVWASPKMGEYITTFNSTSVAQELQAGFLNSLPMCLDELQIQSSQGIKDFDKIIYQLTEGVGKARGAKAGGLQRNQIWKNCIITNGEHPISNSNSGGGAINRIIEFECEEKVYADLPGMCDIITKNYGFAGKEFIEFLQNGGLGLAQRNQRDYFQQLINSDSTDKQAGSASAILAADRIATDLIFKDGKYLTVNDMKKIMVSRKDVDVNERAYQFIFELVGRNPKKFNSDDYGEYAGEVWGVTEIDCVYIIKSVFDRELKNEGFNSAAFLSWAKRSGKIAYDDQRTTKRKQIKGFNKRIPCVCLYTTEIENAFTVVDVDSEDVPF